MRHREMKEVQLRPVVEEHGTAAATRRRSEHLTFDAFDKVILDVCNEQDDWLLDQACESDELKPELVPYHNIT